MQNFMVLVVNHSNRTVIEDKVLGSFASALGFCKIRRKELKLETPEFKPAFRINPIPVNAIVDITDDFEVAMAMYEVETQSVR